MNSIDKVQRVITLDSVVVDLEEKHRRAVFTKDSGEANRVDTELRYFKQEREGIRRTLTTLEEVRYEVECEEPHS